MVHQLQSEVVRRVWFYVGLLGPRKLCADGFLGLLEGLVVVCDF